MFSRLRDLISGITVQDRGHEITIRGFNTEKFRNAIKRHWKSGRIDAHLFHNVTRSSVSFPTFFAPDVLFTLTQLAKVRSPGIPVRHIAKMRDQLLENTWLGNVENKFPTKLNLSRLSDFHFTPKDFQSGFFEFYDQKTQAYRLGGMLLAATAGSGKTYTSLALAQCLEPEIIVVVCPLPALYQVWDDSMKSLYKKPPSYWIAAQNKPYRGERIIIAHYEKLSDLLQLSKTLIGKRSVVILDESHNFNTLDTLRTSSFLELCSVLKTKDVIWLSGTPIKAMSKEAIPLLRCIDPTFTDDVQQRFRKIYKDSNDKGVEIMRHRMGFLSYKVEKSQLQLQDPIFKEIQVITPNGMYYTLDAIRERMKKFTAERLEYYASRRKQDLEVFMEGLNYFEKHMTKSQKPQYEQYRADLKWIMVNVGSPDFWSMLGPINHYELKTILPMLPKDMQVPWKAIRSAVKYPSLKVQGECLGQIVGKAREQCHVEMVEHIDFQGICDSTEKKTVVFTSFVKVLEQIRAKAVDLEISPVFVYGGAEDSLTNVVQKFDTNEDLNPLCTTYKSLSTAVPLIMADTMIMIDPPWRDYVLQQTVSRIHRIGATTQVIVYKCQLYTGDEDNISSRTVDILKWSQQASEEITGVRSPFKLEDFDKANEYALEGDQEYIPQLKTKMPPSMSW